MFSYMAYKLSKSKITFLAIIWILSMTYITVIYKFKGDWWYNTILAYSAGVTFTLYKDKILFFIKRHWIINALTSTLVFALSYYALMQHGNFIVHNCVSILMCVVMVVFMMKVRIHNRFLEWMGKSLFPLYIYMRIPMILFSQNDSFIVNYEALYIIMCITVTLLFGAIYKNIMIKIS